MADHIDAGGAQDHPDQQKAQDGPKSNPMGRKSQEKLKYLGKIGKCGRKVGKTGGHWEENWEKLGKVGKLAGK